MRTYTTRIGLGLLACCAAAGGQDLSTPALRLALSDGVPARIENRLSGESLDLSPLPDRLALLWHNDHVRARTPEEVASVPGEGMVESVFTAADGSRCETVYAADATGEVTVRQQGTSSRKGLYGVQWGLAGVDGGRATVIVPGFSGVAFRKGEAPFSSLSFSWPSAWEAGMVLLQMVEGGFLIWADDPDLRFKTMVLDHDRGRFACRFETQNHAPFAESTAASSVLWRIRAYRGDWRVGAGIYRDWMNTRFRNVPLADQHPAWVRDIRFVVILGVRQQDELPALARMAPPPQTLLYVPDWRRDGYDINYPDYTAADAFGPFVQAAHNLGFRVMPHVNYFGCDYRHPLYERFREVHLRSPHSDDLQWWIPPLDRAKEGERVIQFAYIHPGSAAWRALLVERFRDIVTRYRVDALHLDQTLCIPNHNRGRVDGLTVPEGNLQLHRDLREALPQVALSGEGLDEVTLPFEAFAQRHASHAVDHVHGTWNDAFIRRGHPISSFLFLPCTTIYGYLGMTNPGNAGLYGAWKRAYENWGVVPTLSHPQRGQLGEPSGEMAILLEEAGLWTRHRIVPDFSGPWSAPVLFRHRGEAGLSCVIERTSGGGSRSTVTADGSTRVLYQYLAGRNRWDGPGSIEDWPAYTEESILGLDPAAVYLLDAAPRDLGAARVSQLPEDVVVTGSRRYEGLFAVELAEPGAGKLVAFCDVSADARTGVVVAGQERALERGGHWHVDRSTCNQVPRRTIFAHPPWQGVAGQAAAGLGETFGEFEVALPAEREAELAFAVGLRDGVDGRSDGVTFEIRVEGTALFSRHWSQSAWQEHTVDLAAYRGRTVRLRFVTTPGPDHNATFDWAVWGDPILRLKADDALHEVEVLLPRPARHVLGSRPETVAAGPEREGNMVRYRVVTPLPGGLACVTAEPAAIRLPAALTDLPFTHAATVSGRAARLPLPYCSFGKGQGTAAGEARDGFAAHPPNNGRTYADFLLELPPALRIVLRTAVALQDGAVASGCRFIVEANGREMAGISVAAADGWHPLEADLSAFAGKVVLLSLVVDSEGSYGWDWARWAEPTIETP
ncbi:MAG: hypothetical protein JXR77_16935 [Lentisphaeria bacterium]|nr:hypothetical protein [Lentisphaeria bacterium]